MNILLDESVPRTMARHLRKHDVKTVRDLGWLGIKNGALLSLADEQFHLLITADQNIPYQQRLTRHKIAIRILPTNDWHLIRDRLHLIDSAIESVEPGTCERIEF